MRNTLLTLLLLSSVWAAQAAENAADPAAHDLARAGEAPAAANVPVTAANGAVQTTNLSGVTLAFAPDPGQSDAAAHEEEFKHSMLQLTNSPRLRSAIGLIYDERTGRPLYSKSPDTVTPIASITKLMTAMVVLDAQLPMDELITISKDDIDHHKVTRSRLRPGITMTRGELLKLALMASENRAAAALARTYPGGTPAAMAQMNAKARELGMSNTRFLDPTGLNSGNVSTAEDLVKMVRAAEGYDAIHQYTTSTSHVVQAGRRPLQFHNTNPLVRNSSWDIGISKTGYISEAGRCLVMKATISQHPVIIVLLDSWGRHTRVGDANRVKQWMESGLRRTQL